MAPGNEMDFDSLVDVIRQVHEHMAAQAGRAVNISLTLRNWVVGCYIREYEQNGSDRAQYGAQVVERLARELQSSLDKCYTDRYLRLCRQFYETYPQIRKSLISRFGLPEKGKSAISEWPVLPGSDDSALAPSASTQLIVAGDTLVERLSFSHIIELIKMDDPLRRAFYEIECMRGNWSVRELKRQIGSLYYERSGLSENKEKLATLAQSGAQTAEPKLAVRDPYVFEFLGLKSREVMGESNLEDALLDRLQDFLLELDHGFCFEGRQKRVRIGGTARPSGSCCARGRTTRSWSMPWRTWTTAFSFPSISSSSRPGRRSGVSLKRRSKRWGMGGRGERAGRVARWAMSFEGECQVLLPKELRTKVMEGHRAGVKVQGGR